MLLIFSGLEKEYQVFSPKGMLLAYQVSRFGSKNRRFAIPPYQMILDVECYFKNIKKLIIWK